MTEYDIEYMGVKCTGVEWKNTLYSIFYFTKDGKTYTFIPKEYISCSADTDHIRCVIKDQFLPWWKDQRIKELESENAELRAGLDKKDIFTSGDTDSLSGIQKFFISVVKTGILPQEPGNYDAATLKIYIDHLEYENAALRERLENAVERLKAREQSVCFGREWKAVVTDEDIDEIFGIAEARLAEERT